MKILVLLMTCWVISGCAALATKGDLPAVASFPKTEKSKTLIFRTSSVILLPNGGQDRKPFANEDATEQVLNQTGLFAKVTKYPKRIGQVTLYGDNVAPELERIKAIEFPVDADYFLDLEYGARYYGPHGWMYWGLVHALSLGLIPVAWDNDVHLKATLYDRNGQKLQESKIDDKSTAWGWLPLFFFNGNKLIVKEAEVQYPIQKNALENALSALKF